MQQLGVGLYHPDEFRDNCGFGLIAHIEGKPSHNILVTAIRSLACMTHRGGIASDGKTGDGCGLLMRKPDSFLRTVTADLFEKPLADLYGVGMVFLSQDANKAQKARLALEQEFTAQGLKVVGWRTVPVDPEPCGDIARASLPVIEQVFIEGENLVEHMLNVKLFVAGRKAEIALKDDEDFYIPSLSANVLCYKGLVMPADLPEFYLDLKDPRLETAIVTFHQRFSTNTQPRWPLAQPFRLLAHNGEINTIQGNRNWSVARTAKFSSELLPELDQITPLVNQSGSDSSSMDNMLEFLLAGGVDLYRAVRMLVPPAWQNDESIDPELRAFYEFNALQMEAWDGPAGVVMTDGSHAVCVLDRNGLRPARWVITGDGCITVASEIGVNDYQPEDVVAKGRLGPGEILSVDIHAGKVLHTEDINQLLKSAQPYKRWLRDNLVHIESSLTETFSGDIPIDAALHKASMKLFQVSLEERDLVLKVLAETGQEVTASMGDDVPMAVLSQQTRPLYDYFRQQFAQVTNPPIDSLREGVVMSLETNLGREKNLFKETPEIADRIVLTSPILSTAKFTRLKNLDRPEFSIETISLNYSTDLSLKQAIEAICAKAESAVLDGQSLLVLSDRGIAADTLTVHALLATGAVHHRLIQKGLRCDANIIVETGSVRDTHQFATLFGFGATAVYPYLSYDVIDGLVDDGTLLIDKRRARKNYRKGLNKGLLKILSKMGISTMASYRGAQLFEIVGLDSEVVDLCFRGATSRIQGASFSNIEDDHRTLVASAWLERKPLAIGGMHKVIHGGEFHAFNPDVVNYLQDAVQTGEYKRYRKYADEVNQRPVAAIRDLLNLREDIKPIPIDQVEPIEAILKRFDSAGMSLGALSPEAHEVLATAMNRLGGRSNSGEGGEDAARFGTEKLSKIKQVASGRFGVTPHYLVNAEVIQIKIAQGAKPGEGGQLPGGKVNELIARLRYSVPGVTLISPPPHHDIYSIEDLAQLIFDLKQVNPEALVSVKLVSEPGVGTIAAGVTKAYADLITISGYDGGTAASPLTSIRYAGSPWELGLSETHQALRSNDMRGRVRVQTDGGLKTGLDVTKGAILGAESFGFGTTPMIAMGCRFLRICHLNNCATGVATQHEGLREEHFNGDVEMVMNFFKFVAMETREWMASLGVASLEELIGRTDLLSVAEGFTDKQKNLDLSPILESHESTQGKPQFCQQERNEPFDKGLLAERMVEDMLGAIENATGGTFSYDVSNCDRSIGARLSGEIARRHGNNGMIDNPITIHLDGVVGQSFGVWNAGGLDMYLSGDANDFVGKGMAGGKLVIAPPPKSQFKSNETPIVGNTCLYGATGGKLYAAGRAGERFGVRNSGAHAVVEGVGDHCCEYMTGGVITVLGETGVNFGAGMTGGFAYVLDMKHQFVDRYNHQLVDIDRIRNDFMEGHRTHLRGVISEYVKETNSEWGKTILENFEDYVPHFWLVKPKASNPLMLLGGL